MGEPSAAKTVLLVDDEETMRKILQRRLGASGYRVLTACDGVEGVEAAQRQHPDLILLDAMMPRMNGLEACRTLKAHPATRRIPIIMLTANVSDLLREQVLEAGAAACLHKPFESKQLLEAISQAIDAARGGASS